MDFPSFLFEYPFEEKVVAGISIASCPREISTNATQSTMENMSITLENISRASDCIYERPGTTAATLADFQYLHSDAVTIKEYLLLFNVFALLF